MLELRNITKIYSTGSSEVRALKGIDLKFRKCDFVSILGPSGCGKTTMLNIIGGLDQYTEGDLIINSKSTKAYKDRDWDTYRNHSIGFVFQSYNLIPHQSVLQNVELALTLSGVSKTQRRERAIEALKMVGLGDQLKKRPSEMSGGQMQRVAIARALVNNPDIILADEPTGALDTETSVQVMEILKEVSRDRLVIMVTHNPELAEKYSTRIIRMLDGVITSDSAPLTDEEAESYRREDKKALEAEQAKKKKEKKPSMSFATAFGLSLKNLFTKKGRTALTSFAGSIGIIGIALIFSLSNGATAYINAVQEDTLSAYPLTLEATTVDMSVLMETFMGVGDDASKEHGLDAVYSQAVMIDMLNALNNMDTTENDLRSFKEYLETKIKESGSTLESAVNGVQYSYDLDLLIYTKDVDGKIIRSDSEELMMNAIKEHMGMDLSAMMGSAGNSAFGSMMQAESSMMSARVWSEILSDKNGGLVSPVVEGQYDVIYGSWPNEYNEVVLVVDENNEIDDMTLYALGLKSEEEIKEAFDAVKHGTEVTNNQKKWSYEEICSMDFRVILNSSRYSYDSSTNTWVDLSKTDAGLQLLWSKGFDLKVTGIIRPNKDATSTMISGSIAYTKALTEHVINESSKSDAVSAQKADPETDIFTGLPFPNTSEGLTAAEKKSAFIEHVNALSEEERIEFYKEMVCTPTKEQVNEEMDRFLKGATPLQLQQAFMEIMGDQGNAGASMEEMMEQFSSASPEQIKEYYKALAADYTAEKLKQENLKKLEDTDPEKLLEALNASLAALSDEDAAFYYDNTLQFSKSSYEKNLSDLGAIDLSSPEKMNIYASSFENKDIIEEAIAEYNDSVDDLKKIRYTDYVGIMMSSITTIINAITYVLVAFVSISLVVSSIMIAVITLISVQERTKEIGILRAIGASKKNVSSMFNAETIIIGLASGLLGVIITVLLCIPINAIIQALTGIGNIRAFLPVAPAVILVIISVLLNLISGIIPSRSAAKKDPVVALRSE